MGQKKTMKLWQMLTLTGLSVVLLITIFLPAYHLNGKAVLKMYDKMLSKEMRELAQGLGGIDRNAIMEQVDKEIEEQEEEYGIKLSSITTGRIMVHSFESCFGEMAEEDVFKDLKSGYTKQRILLWVVYILAVIVILLISLGYCLQWSKYIVLPVSIGYGFIAVIIFGLFQFWAPKSVAKAADFGDAYGLGMFGLGSAEGMLEKMVSCFWGTAFLTAFVIAVLLVIVSVLSIFTGNGSRQSNITDSDVPGNVYGDPGSVYADPGSNVYADPGSNVYADPGSNVYADPGSNVSGGSAVSGGPVNGVSSGPVNSASGVPVNNVFDGPGNNVAVQTPPMGQVRCTKGVAAGQGFSLPEDRKVVVGKSSQSANMIIAHPNVSKVHCSIRYKAAANSYVVKDHSMNGTFVNGVRLQKDVAMEFPAGTVLHLADGSNEITLG